MTLKLKTADFRLLTRSRRLSGPTRSAEAMYGVAERLLTREADGRAFRLIGVGAHDLIQAAESPQADLLRDGPQDGPVDRHWTACGKSSARQRSSRGAASA